MRAQAEARGGRGAARVFRKGEVGDWRAHFDDALVREFDELYEREMAGIDVELFYPVAVLLCGARTRCVTAM